MTAKLERVLNGLKDSSASEAWAIAEVIWDGIDGMGPKEAEEHALAMARELESWAKAVVVALKPKLRCPNCNRIFGKSNGPRVCKIAEPCRNPYKEAVK